MSIAKMKVKTTKLSLIRIGLMLSFILWPIISGIAFTYLQLLLVFDDGYSPATNSWFGMVSRVMFFRIIIAFILPVMLLVHARRSSINKPRLKPILLGTYLATAVGLVVFFFPYSFWKTRIIKPPPQTFEKSYRYKITSTTEPSETELRFSSHASAEVTLDYYYNLLRQNGLCLGVQSQIPERRCFPRDKIDPGNTSWTINTIKPGKRRNSTGINWGFVHFLGNTKEGSTKVWITLNNYSK